MKLIIDIELIRRLSKKKEEKNWGFRSFLKSCEIPSGKIDLVAHRLYKHITERIDCTQCGNCCKEIEPVLTSEDISTCSKGLKLSEKKFKNRYLVKTQEENKYTFNQKPCPFLIGTICSIYDHRPADCRSYPHIHKKALVSRLIGLIHNCSICPIAFNVYEGLKSKIWSMCDDFDVDEIDEDDINL